MAQLRLCFAFPVNMFVLSTTCLHQREEMHAWEKPAVDWIMDIADTVFLKQGGS